MSTLPLELDLMGNGELMRGGEVSWDISSMTEKSVGTALGSKSSRTFKSMITDIFPVLGWTEKGDLSKWLNEEETFVSILG